MLCVLEEHGSGKIRQEMYPSFFYIKTHGREQVACCTLARSMGLFILGRGPRRGGEGNLQFFVQAFTLGAIEASIPIVSILHCPRAHPCMYIKLERADLAEHDRG